jgi:hypothetical protein
LLPLLIGLLVAGGPLLRGAWDLWSQSLLFLCVLTGFSAWVVGRVIVGYVPLPERRLTAWAAALAFLAALSAAISPVPMTAVPAWRWVTLGLAIFPLLSVVSKDERAWIDEAIRVAAWLLLILAFYQRLHEHMPRPPSTFLNQNVFAGTVLMLLPLAVQKRDWLLTAGLVLCLLWARSVGAWLGLASALMLSRRQSAGGVVGYWLGAGIGFVCAVAIYAKLQSPEVLDRVAWWSAAARMAWSRPWFGFGPGSYAFVFPAVAPREGGGLGSLYAHQHFLEAAAENGLPYMLLWAAGLVHVLRRGGTHKRFGALAVLVQSLWDYPLSIPANFWLFCYFAASSSSQSPRGLNVPMRRKLPAALLVAVICAAGFRWAWRRWEADRLMAAAVERFEEGGGPLEVHGLLESSFAYAVDPEAERLCAEMDVKRIQLGQLDPRKGVAEAAAHLEAAVALDPFRASNWTALARFYSQLGQQDRARRASEHAAALGATPAPE